MQIDWGNIERTPELNDLSKSLIREISENFFATGTGLPDHKKKVELGKDRLLLDALLKEGLAMNIAGRYYPRFAALYFLTPELRRRCEEATTWVLKAARSLYAEHGTPSLSFDQISDQINRLASPPVGQHAARIGMQFARDFTHYFGNFHNSSEGHATSATVSDNILDFDDLPQAWQEEKESMSNPPVSHINVDANDVLNEANELDDLLPLYRRRVFDADLVRLSKETLESGSSLVMIMIDLDHFKAINDTHGHAIGDEVLVGASKVVADRVRGKGKAYRYGGEEFALLLPNYTSDEGVALAETIRKQIEQSAFSATNLKVTASLGLAAVPENANNSNEVLKAADAAMYQAKHFGRNLVRVFGEQMPLERQRTPGRKSPVLRALSDDDQENIRTAYFSGHQPECPKDGVPLRILKEFHEVGRRTPTIMIMCPICGLQEMIHGLD